MKGGMLVQGKYEIAHEHQHQSEPYSGIAAACGDICEQILAMKDDAANPETSALLESFKVKKKTVV